MTDPWARWAEVTDHISSIPGHRLFRASSPNYKGFDASQNLDEAAIQVLVSRGINRVISFNSITYTDSQIARLKEEGIEYRHFPVKDFTPPTIEQLRAVIDFFREDTPDGTSVSTLVHCGHGHGRTGTGVTAIQLFATSGISPPEVEWFSVNHVENLEQYEVLKTFRDSCQRGP